jgi:hypothetical protein
MKSAIQKLNKSTVFHQRNRYGRNLQFSASRYVLFLRVPGLYPFLATGFSGDGA